VTATAGRTVTGSEPGWGILTPEEQVSYAEVVRKVTGMVQDSDTSGRVTRRGMNLINVMWEDTGRFQGSSVGPNISDLTLQVRYTENGQPRAALLPVIRFPNFSDRTGDIPAEKFFVRTGNQKKNGKLETVLLTDVLKDVKSFVSDPKSVKGSGNLLAKRDTHFLVSAQAVFLPVPKKGHAEFTPVLFNYQSFKGSPAVATILVTRQGTSMTVIENDGSESSPIAANGQELYFNKGGERAPFTAERRTDVVQRIEAQGGPKTEDDRSAIAKGADTLFIIQVPLKQKQIARGDGPGWGGGVALGGAMPPPQAAPAAPHGGRLCSAVQEERREGEERRRAGGARPRQGGGEVLRGPQPAVRARRSLPDPRDRAVLQGNLERCGGGQRSRRHHPRGRQRVRARRLRRLPGDAGGRREAPDGLAEDAQLVRSVTSAARACLFCAIVRGDSAAAIVGRGGAGDSAWTAFLDIAPLFQGHALVVPDAHRETLLDLSPAENAALFAAAQRVAQAVTAAAGAQGTFVAMNNKVSQSVPHLHVHVVPRTKGDGLKGFFWPRKKYASADELESVRAAIAAKLDAS
jgi:diadenosine tetraphosphate (Ap4A) HIT family hydrolase